MLSRLAATPVEGIITQFAVEMQEIALLHLGLSSERLAPNHDALAQAVSQLRLAYVEVMNAARAEGGSPE